MQIINTVNDYHINVAMDGLGGAGKTSMLDLPDEGPTWTREGKPGKVLYIAADMTSRGLRSFSSHMRERVEGRIVIPDGNPVWKEIKDPNDNNKTIKLLELNWRKEMSDICKTRWSEKFGDICAVVYDTGTASCQELLGQSAQDADFSEKGPTSVLKGKQKLGKEDGIALGSEGDYRMVQQTAIRFFKHLLLWNDDVHVFVLFHEGWNGVIQKFGPMTVGSMGPIQMPPLFDANIHVEIESNNATGHKGDTKVVHRDDKRTCNIKCNDSSLIPDFKYVKPDRTARIEYWNWLHEVQR